MFELTSEQAKHAFASAKNLNAALKHFLKKSELTNKEEKFAKNFRVAVSAGKNRVDFFIDNNFATQQKLFLKVSHFAFSELFSETIETIITKYGEEFNSTYSQNDNDVSILDESNFKRIIKEVKIILDEFFSKLNHPSEAFLKVSILTCIFDEALWGFVK